MDGGSEVRARLHLGSGVPIDLFIGGDCSLSHHTIFSGDSSSSHHHHFFPAIAPHRSTTIFSGDFSSTHHHHLFRSLLLNPPATTTLFRVLSVCACYVLSMLRVCMCAVYVGASVCCVCVLCVLCVLYYIVTKQAPVV